MASKVYIETTIVSYLTGQRSRNIIVAGHQETTIEWWQHHRNRFSIYISPFVINEAGKGDPKAAKDRLEIIKEFPVLTVDEEVIKLTNAILDYNIIPPKASTDASHIAIATRHGMDFLLTWNCTHIANAEILRRVEKALLDEGYVTPVICTPDELMGGLKNDR